MLKFLADLFSEMICIDMYMVDGSAPVIILGRTIRTTSTKTRR